MNGSRIALFIWLACWGLGGLSNPARAATLGVPEVIQEQDQWCWAAVSKSIFAYYGQTIEQCVIAEYTRSVATWHNFGNDDCCQNPSGLCNYWNYMNFYAGSITDILDHWGLSGTSRYYALSLATIQTLIDDLRPFVVRWGWDVGGGHFVLGQGVDGDTVHYMNPWFGEGHKTSTYSWLVQGSGHTWTHSIELDTSFCSCQSSDACCDGCVPINEGGACDDSDLCTSGDVCLAGACQSGSPVTCGALDDCHLAGVCNPADGQCSNPLAEDGSACEEGNLCTGGDSCLAGVCQPGEELACQALDQCHSVGVCEPATGLCSDPVLDDGLACDDGDLCSQSDTCQSGVCVGAQPIVCQALDQCHLVGTCEPSTGQCSAPLAPNGTLCSDGDLCTLSDTCAAGICVGAQPVVCQALDQCHLVGECDPLSGQCTNPSLADGSACDDGDLCTRSDSCQGGLCTGSAPVSCAPPGEVCHAQGSCQPDSGLCDDPLEPDGSSCDDLNPCTDGDSCIQGICQSGEALPDWSDCETDRACFSSRCEPVPAGDRCPDPLTLEEGTPITVDFAGYHSFRQVQAPCLEPAVSGRDIFMTFPVEPGFTYSLLVTPEDSVDLSLVLHADCAGEDSTCLLAESGQLTQAQEFLATSFDQAGSATIQILRRDEGTSSTQLELIVRSDQTDCGCASTNSNLSLWALVWFGLGVIQLRRKKR